MKQQQQSTEELKCLCCYKENTLRSFNYTFPPCVKTLFGISKQSGPFCTKCHYLYFHIPKKMILPDNKVPVINSIRRLHNKDELTKEQMMEHFGIKVEKIDLNSSSPTRKLYFEFSESDEDIQSPPDLSPTSVQMKRKRDYVEIVLEDEETKRQKIEVMPSIVHIQSQLFIQLVEEGRCEFCGSNRKVNDTRIVGNVMEVYGVCTSDNCEQEFCRTTSEIELGTNYYVVNRSNAL
jgi:hypothetical protein